MQPPSVILTGDLRLDSVQVRFELGRGMAAASPQNVLRLGLPESEGGDLFEALLAAFGPHERAGRLSGPSVRMAESFWQVLPPRTQRRMQRLFADGVVPAYEDVVAAAQQSARRVGMFLAGDFAHAAEVTLAECSPGLHLASPRDLRDACRTIPQLADLLLLAVSPEYASARWSEGDPSSQRSPSSGRFSLF
jgi:hypothetical protein